MSKTFWLLSAGLVALATPAYAQDDPTTPEEAPTSTSGTEQGAVQEGDEAAENEGAGIVVTAQGRRQILQDVPLAVSAVGGEQMQNSGATDIRQLNQLAPSLLVSSTGSEGNGSARIRGIGTVGDNPGLESSVAVFIDGVYRSRSGIGLNELGEVERIEVLRGPQGTLFGAGSLSGTVRYITNQPELGVRSTFGELGGSWVAGGNGGANVKVGTNVPLGDRAAARLAVYHNQLPGYMDATQPDLSVDENVNTGARTGVRAALRFAPSEQFSVTPRIVFQRVEMDGWNRIDTFNILANPYTTTRPRVTLGERKLFTQIEEPFTDDFVLGDLNLGYNFGPVNLTSITSYTYRDVLVVRDAGALTSSITGGSIALPEEIYTLNAPLDDATESRVFTQEIRFAGGGTLARWLIGGFFSSNQRDYGQSLIVSGFEAASGFSTQGLRAARDELFFSDLSYDLKQTAVFGEGTLTLGGRLDLTAGLRYYNFSEDREQVFDGIFAHDNTGTAVVSVPGSTDADGFAPRFILSFRPNEMLALNAQASKGFRLGGINDPLNVPLCSAADLAQFSGRDSWRDETAWNYEVGAKSQWMGGRLSLNLSAFYMDITDLQLSVTAGTCSSRLIFNVPDALSQGAEIELVAAPNENFDFSVAATFTDSELRSTLISRDDAGNETVISGIREGNRLPSVPKRQASASATWRWPFRGGAQGFVTGTYQHVGSRYTQIDDLGAALGTRVPRVGSEFVVDLEGFPKDCDAAGNCGATIGGPLSQSTFGFNPELPAYNLVNARVGVTRPSWEIALFVNNLTDERAFLALDRERGTRARVGYLTNQPRTFGVNLTFNY
jgi:iron complex outermembrane recepter protein